MEKKKESQVITREEIKEVLKSLNRVTESVISESSIQDPDRLKSNTEEVERYIQSFEGMDKDAVALIIATSMPLISPIAAISIANLAKNIAMNKLVSTFLK